MNYLIAPKIVEILTQNNFFVELSEIFTPDLSPFTFLYNKKNEKGIIMCEYSLNQEGIAKKINQDVSEVRGQLNRADYNVWNIYYFIINIDEVNNKNIYTIERDYRNMRKYVICSAKDLNRIPFIKCTSEKNKHLDIFEFKSSNPSENIDVEIENLVDDIKKNKGEYLEFSRTKIKEILNNNLLQGEFE